MQDEVVLAKIAGTFEYMPPELVLKEFHTNKFDSWSLGILFYELIEGYCPFDARSLDKIKIQMSNPNFNFKKNIPDQYKKVILSLLNFDIDKRLTIQEFLENDLVQKNLEYLEKEFTQKEKDFLFSNRCYNELEYKNNVIFHDPVKRVIKNFDKQGNSFIETIEIPKTIEQTENQFQHLNTLIRGEKKIIKSNSATALENIKTLDNKSLNYEFQYLLKNKFLKETVIQIAIENRTNFHKSGKIIVLERNVDWKEDIYKLEKKNNLEGMINFVIFWEESLKLYVVNSVFYENDKFVVRKLIKNIFRGKCREKLIALSNLNDFFFCNTLGTMAGLGTLISALVVADLSLY